MRILEIYDIVNCTRFRIRRTKDLTDYLITGLKQTPWGGEDKFAARPSIFSAWRLDASQQSCDLQDGPFSGWVLLSSPQELTRINCMGEKKLYQCLRESYS